MQRTISIKLQTTPEQDKALADTQAAYTDACNMLVPYVVENRCWNRNKLHNLAYYQIREQSVLGSQMVCNTIRSVCGSYKALKELGKITRDNIPEISYKRKSVHYCARTFSLSKGRLSLYTLTGRVKPAMIIGDFQESIWKNGEYTEANLIRCSGTWYFNLTIEIETPEPLNTGVVVGVDVGENNLAATSTGKIYGGGDLRHRRDKHLSLRRRLQSNGTQSAKQKLRKVSGKERRRVKHINHETSKKIVGEAVNHGADTIVLEDLTNIRDNIKSGKRIRTRLNRWAFRQLQTFVEYKASAFGIAVKYVDPAYTSQTCSVCGQIGKRSKHLFSCQCGFRAHADLNAGRNLARIGGSIEPPRATVN